MSSAKDFTESSGNVFADLGIKHPEEMQAKTQIAYHIAHLTQK